MSDDDLYFGEQGPTKLEFRITGVLGLIVFCSVILIAYRGFLTTSHSHLHLRIFFLSILVSAAFELPRYIMFTKDGRYTSKAGYAMHMFAGLFYFLSLSIVCYMWSCIVHLGTVSTLLYSKHGLIAANMLLGSVLLAASISCLTASSLSSFFHSDLFILFVAEEIIQSLLYTAGLTLYGVSMIYKLKYANGTALPNLQRLLVRITATLGLTSLASLLRLIMCCLQIASAKSDFSISSSTFSHYWIIWFSLAEFVPRGGSSLALMIFMSKRSHQANRREIRERYVGSDNIGGTILSSTKNVSSGMEHSSMSSVNGCIIDKDRDSVLFKSLNGFSNSDPMREELIPSFNGSYDC